MRELLLLRAEDEDDLRVVSACAQDMAVKAGDFRWNPRKRQLVLIGNRFRWEAAKEGQPPSRVRSALRFDHVIRVQRREWPAETEMVLPLMAIKPEDNALVLLFGGGTQLRLETEVIDVSLDDLSGPWGALSQPDHKLV